MKKLTAIFIFALLTSIPAFSQEMPDDLKTRLEAKSAELNPDSDAAARAWLRKQTNAWESMQNMVFPVSKSDVDMLKSAAEKKYPLDFVEQELFLTSQVEFVAVMAEYRTKLGEADFEGIKKAFDETEDFDLNALTQILIKQSLAKDAIAALKPGEGVNEMTFTITKEVAAKNFPHDYIKQLAAVREQLGIFGEADGPEASSASAGTTDGEAGQPGRVMNVSELNRLSRTLFGEETLIMESGDSKASVLFTEIQGKQVLIAPASGYGEDASVLNAMGESADFNKNAIYASVNLPVIMIIPDSVPSGLKPATLITEKEYRELIGENIFFVGYSGSNIQSFPIRINAISDIYLTMSSRIPNNFIEGTLLLNSRDNTTVGMAVRAPVRLPSVNWTERGSINKYSRALNDSRGSLVCIRLDKLDKWQKVDVDKLNSQKKTLDRLSGISADIISLLTATKMEDSQNRPYVGDIVKKHIKGFKTRMEKVRFERLYRAYLQEMATFIKNEIRDIKPNEFYTLYRSDLTQQLQTLDSALKAFEKSAQSQLTDLMHDDIKRFHNM